MTIREFLIYFGVYIVSGALFILLMVVEQYYVYHKYSSQLSDNEKIIRENAAFINNLNRYNKLKNKGIFITLLWPYYGYYIFNILEETKKIYKPKEINSYIKESNMNFKKTVVSMIFYNFVENNSSKMFNENDLDFKNIKSLLMKDCEQILANDFSIKEIKNIADKYNLFFL